MGKHEIEARRAETAWCHRPLDLLTVQAVDKVIQNCLLREKLSDMSSLRNRVEAEPFPLSNISRCCTEYGGWEEQVSVHSLLLVLMSRGIGEPVDGHVREMADFGLDDGPEMHCSSDMF